ncbi:shikimate kinase AroK [Endothiovibrio diazotrophicus]
MRGMTRKQNLILVGPMGAGKSTIGRQLGEELGMEFVDSDKEIERRTGVDIPLIFELEGEAGFRKRESAMIHELAGTAGTVLATGGGAVLDPENRTVLAARGTVIYLHASIDQLVKRTARDRNRPLLQGGDPRRKLEEIMAVREPLYREVADIAIDTSGRSVRAVVKELLERLEEE